MEARTQKPRSEGGLGLNAPRGLCLADTSGAADGRLGKQALYVCDTGNSRLVALEPTTLAELFAFGQPGSSAAVEGGGEGGSEGHLLRPVSVCACGGHLAVADAGHSQILLFTLRGTFVRSIGERASKFASIQRAGVFMHPPAHIAMAPGHLFVVCERPRSACAGGRPASA